MLRPGVDICRFDPGFAVDVTVTADVQALAQVCLGHIGLPQAVKAGDVELSGPSHQRRALYDVLGVTRFAALSNAAASATSR